MEIQHFSGPSAYTGQAQADQTTGAGLVEAQQRLRRMVLDTLPSPNSRRNYARPLEDLFAFSAGA